MPNLDTWLGDNKITVLDAQDAAERAVLAWQHIQDDVTSLTLIRRGTTLDAQDMRVELYPSGRPIHNEAGFAPDVVSFVIFGVIGHPGPDVPDTDLLRGDRFVIGNQEYVINTVQVYPGEIQGVGMAVT